MVSRGLTVNPQKSTRNKWITVNYARVLLTLFFYECISEYNKTKIENMLYASYRHTDVHSGASGRYNVGDEYPEEGEHDILHEVAHGLHFASIAMLGFLVVEVYPDFDIY